MHNCPPIGLGLTLSVPIPADALPICDNAVSMIGADGDDLSVVWSYSEMSVNVNGLVVVGSGLAFEW